MKKSIKNHKKKRGNGMNKKNQIKKIQIIERI